MTVKAILSAKGSEVHTIEPTTNLAAAAKLLAERKVGALVVTGLDAAAIGDLAAGHGIALHALVPRQASLEDVYLDLTGESVDYRAAAPEGVPSR